MGSRLVSAPALLVCALAAHAQPPAEQPAIVIANPNATFPAKQRELSPPETIARGRGLYEVNCQACHGADLRGGDQGGPNLLRSEVVLNDVAGEVIGDLVRQGRNRMPANTSLDRGALEAVAGYIHSVLATAEGQGAPPRVEYDLDILVGDPAAGASYFNRECAACHSPSGDLAGIGSRIADPVDLQNSWVAGRRPQRFGAPPEPGADDSKPMVTVTPRDGESVAGTLVRYDDFFVSLRTAEGEYRSFTRRDGAPAIAIADPLARHRELLAELTDETMHDVTAYLETLR